jgi:hypothetical protein
MLIPQKRLHKKQVINISEYDLYKEAIKKTDIQLLEQGFSIYQIKELRKNTYMEQLKNIGTLNKSEIKDLGYSQEQIEMIKNLNGNEKEIYSLSPKLKIDICEIKKNRDSSHTECTVQVKWNWSRCPFYQMTDIITVAWSNGMYCNTSNNNNWVHFYWHNKYNNKFINVSESRLIANLNYGVNVKKDIGRPGFNSYLKSGIMNINVTKKDFIDELFFLAKYGHSQYRLDSLTTISKRSSFCHYVKDISIGQLYISYER